MAIRCGCCGGEHDTAAEVRTCCDGLASAPAAPASGPVLASGPASEPAVVLTSVLAARTLAELAGPDELGRSLVVSPGGEVGEPWRQAARVTVNAAALEDPAALVDELRPRFLARQRQVIELEPGLPWPPLVEPRPPFQLGPSYELSSDVAHHLLWANSIDGRDVDHPRWAWGDLAVELGARPGGPADVVLPDGTRAWCDGGPLANGAVPGRVVHRISLEHGSLTPLGPNVTGAVLAPDQLAAVTHPGGGARIIAPAGSGKTRVLTERARLLLSGWRFPASALCLVAFNKRAQQEMEGRTSDLPGLRVRTLNSLGLSIVNGDAPFARRGSRLQTIDEREVRQLLSRLVKLPRRRNVDPLATWVEALGTARLGLRDPVDVERSYGSDLPGFAEAHDRYRAELRGRGVLDFDEQILHAVEVLLTEPAVRLQAQRVCRLLLVDEFQDLTPADLLLVRLLAAPAYEVFGVGDDDQTIYGYNGADPTWLIDYDRYFPGAADHPLEVNYRCPPGVVRAADTLLRHNRRRVAKSIRAGRPAESGPGWSVVETADAAATTVAVVGDLLSRGNEPRDIALLARVNVVLAPVQVALTERGVPVVRTIGPELLERTAVRAALAWLRLAGGRWSRDDLQEVVRRPSRSLSPRLGEWVADQNDLAGLRRLAGRLRDERDARRVGELADDIEGLASLAGTEPLPAVLDHLFDTIGLAPSVATLDGARHGMNATAQADDLEALRSLALLHPDVAGFETWLRGALARPSDEAGVTLSSVHRVKGQEWRHVILHDVDADQFPHRLADDREEERRVFHVAITRAVESVTLVTTTRPSPFVAELTTEPTAAPAEPPPPRAVLPQKVRRAERQPTTGPLVDRLKALRRSLADGKPAYTVFDDKTLEAIVTTMPRTLAELSRVRGIGPARLEAYGRQILDTVDEARTQPSP